MTSLPQTTTSTPPLPDLPPNHRAQSYGGLPARQLLTAVQLAASDLNDPDAQVVFTAFYYRYRRYLYKVVLNALKFVYDADAQEEIVNDALAVFFRQSEKLTLPAAKDDAACDKIIRTYLGKLAKWKALDALDFQKSFGRDVLDEEAIAKNLERLGKAGYKGDAKKSETTTRPELSEVEAWMESLNELERDVIRAYFLDDHAGQKSERLPSGIAARLAKKHQTTTSNLRHIKAKLETRFRQKFGSN